MNTSKIIIIDFGSAYSQLVAKKIRAAGIYSELHNCLTPLATIKEMKPSALVITGGSESLSLGETPALDPEFLNLGIPVLGIAQGQNLIANAYAKLNKSTVELTKSTLTGHSHCTIKLQGSSKLFKDLPTSFNAWMAGADKLTALPQDFVATATTDNFEIAAMENPSKQIYTVQFNPESQHSEHGDKILHNFISEVAKLKGEWTIPAFTEKMIADCRKQVGSSNVVLGLSGGIDSTVVAALLHKAIGKQLHCIFVDHGLLRKFESQEVVEAIRRYLPGVNLKLVEAQDRFLDLLEGVDDPEQKRKIIGRTFIEVFEEEAKAIKDVDFLAQGTIYPDVIESFSAKGNVIKTHHNVGGLPDYMKLKLVEPLRELFKDEVRKVGEELGLPEVLVWRHPFPGPGLAVRQLGKITRERLDILKNADRILYEELWESGWYRKVWQAFAILLNQQSTGVRNDTRTYENVIAIRSVDSVDAMSATWSPLPYDLLMKVSQRIINEVVGVNRVVYDISAKPPSTIEWE